MSIAGGRQMFPRWMAEHWVKYFCSMRSWEEGNLRQYVICVIQMQGAVREEAL